MSTKRIKPDELLAAYLKIGATPARGIYYDKATNRGDGVGVYCVAVLGHSGEPGVGMYFMAMELAGFDRMYVDGFLRGFSGVGGEAPLEGRFGHWAIGYVDGKAAWDAVEHLAKEVDSA